MDGRPGEDDAEEIAHRPDVGSHDRPSSHDDEPSSPDHELADGADESGWPYDPEVDTGEGSTSGDATAGSLEDVSDSEVASVFWRVLLLVDVAMLCLTIGPLLVVVRDSPGRGIGLFLLGLVALGYAYTIYRDYRDGDDGNGASGDDTGDDASERASPERNG